MGLFRRWSTLLKKDFAVMENDKEDERERETETDGERAFLTPEDGK